MPLQDRHDIFTKLLSAERLSILHKAGQVTSGLPFGESVFECGGYQPTGLVPSHIFMTEESKSEQGFTTFLPAMLGAVPCVASKIA